jgi:branched-subunit amino acid ABC-type transport system permease component
MKKIILEFLRRGVIACGVGPLVLAIVYLISQHHVAVKVLTVNQVCLGIFSLSALSFVAGGMNVIYQIERLPLMAAIFIHGGILYIGYLATYLLNDWLEWGATPFLVFSGIFILGYLAIWVIIYCVLKRNTEKINKRLKQKQQFAKNQ